MSPLSFLRRSTSSMAGPEHPEISSMPLRPMGGPGRPAQEESVSCSTPSASPAESRPPLAAELRLVESLDDFQALVRRHQADRIYLDVLEYSPPDAALAAAPFVVLLSASKGGTDILARLPWQVGRNGGAVPDIHTFRNVLRSRFLFLGYSVSDGLASVRLARHLPVGEPPAATARSA